jgi:hypothetical protein
VCYGPDSSHTRREQYRSQTGIQRSGELDDEYSGQRLPEAMLVSLRRGNQEALEQSLIVLPCIGNSCYEIADAP